MANNSLRLIFAGTPELVLPTLMTLLDSPHEIVSVYTQPDRPAGRGQKLNASAVKELALKHHLPVYQPSSLKNIDEQNILRQQNADVMVVMAYGMILPAEVLTIPRFGCINVHPSLLPRWRGATPIERPILAGDKETGVCIMQMEAGLDTGPVLAETKCMINPHETSGELQPRLADLSGPLLLDVLNQLPAILTQAKKQDETLVTYAHKIVKEEARIDWQQTAEQIDRQIRAFNPRPIAFSTLQDQLVRIWQAEPIEEMTTASPGTIIRSDKSGIDVSTSNSIIRILQCQLPGRRCLPVAEILNSNQCLFAVGNQFS